jgi:putative serine protease PepD
MLPNSRTAATLAAALLLGAGGGAGAAVAIDNGNSGGTTALSPGGAATSASSSSDGTTASAVYQRTKQGVVDITVKTQAASSSSSPFGAPAPSGAASTAEGSGFVLDKDGNIVTNQHVVDGATSIQVKFADGTKVSAKVVGQDASSDVAVIRVSGVDQSKLQPLALGDSSKVAVGDTVSAIGSPYGLQGSLSEGVVSALNRTITSPNNYSLAGAIQTDAAINHGNSGGPLLDASGEVIGVNAQIEGNTGENTGVGFAIPSNTIKRVSSQILSGDRVSHPFVGVQLSDADGGASVASVTSGGPAADAGVHRGDVITAVDGKKVDSSDAVVSAIQAHNTGDTVTLTVHRADSSHQIAVKLGNQPASAS